MFVMKKITLLSIITFLPFLVFAYPWAHRYTTEQSNQNISVDISNSFTVSVEWGEGSWTSTSFGYGLSTDGTGWTWVDLPWFQDGGGTNKRCKTNVSISTPGKFYYAYRLIKSGITSYSFGSDSWAENSTSLSAISFIDVADFTVSAGNWSSTSTWNSGSVPTSTKNVGIYHNLTLDQNAEIKSLMINTGATFTASDASPRTLTITKSASGSTTTLANSGTWANGSGGSTVIFTGAPSSGDAIHAITGTIAFQNLTVNKTGGSSNVGASFGAGTSLTGTLEIGSGGFISTNPPTGFYGTGAILKFNQGALATYDVNSGDKTWSTTEVPQNITVTSGKVKVNENRTATGNLIISIDGTLELAAAKQLSINSTLTNNGTLTLKSADGVGTATIISLGTVDGSGTTNVEQFVSSTATGVSGRNWYISSPLSAATSSTITTTTGNDLVYWNGTAWTAAGTTMDLLKGYIAVSPNGNKTIQFTGGNLNTGNQTATNLPLGFNLVGNPYASYLNWSQATKTAVSTSIWYRSKSSGSYVFQTYNVAGDGVSVNGGTNIIPPMQSFWIKTTNATNSLGFTNAMRSHQDQSVATSRLKAPTVNTQKLARLEIANGADKDETVVYFNENALNTFDDFDSQKMFNETAGAPELYTLNDNKNLVINGFNAVQLNTEIPLGFRTGIANNTESYTLKASQLQNFGTETELVLIDKDNNNSETIMNEGSEYTFTSGVVNTTNRFSLVFKAKGTTTGKCCFNTFENKVIIQKNDNNQLVVNCDNEALKNASISIFNTAGQKLTEQKLNNSATTINTAFKAGVYLVKLQSEGKTYHVKITI